jgi:murein L,D-transpeptidase YcbB/YkuD
MVPRRIAGAAVLCLFLAASLASPQNPSLQSLIERGRHPAIRWGRFPDVQEAALALYRGNGWEPLWLGNRRPIAEARALIDVLATANDRGLDPEDYDASQLAALLATLDRGGADREQAIRFDAALTIGALRFTRALARGRVGPSSAEPFNGATVVQTIRKTGRADSIVSALEPDWKPYRELKHALGRYRRFAKDSVARRAFFQSRIQRIGLALERWRWLPHRNSERAIYLYAPAGRLQLVNPDGTSTWFSAQIGEGCRRASAQVSEFWMVVFRPAEHPGSELKFPGFGDAPIYQSSGPAGLKSCAVVPDLERVAEELLKDRPDWPPVRVRATASANRQVFARLRQPVVVVYVYTTALVEQGGQVEFFEDAYRLDRSLTLALRKGYPY